MFSSPLKRFLAILAVVVNVCKADICFGSYTNIDVAIGFGKAFCNQFGGGSLSAASSYASSLVHDASDFFEVNGLCVSLNVVYVDGNYGSSNYDSYVGVCSQQALDDFDDYWSGGSLGSIGDTVIFLSPQEFSSSGCDGTLGRARQSGACDDNRKFAVSFVNPSESQSGQTETIAHEIGHNLGATHTEWLWFLDWYTLMEADKSDWWFKRFGVVSRDQMEDYVDANC